MLPTSTPTSSVKRMSKLPTWLSSCADDALQLLAVHLLEQAGGDRH